MTIARYEDGLTGPEPAVWLSVFRRQRAFAEHAFDQLDDAQFFEVPAPGLNAVAVIARHLAGNMRSRWTDFLTTDGEKPTRDRDEELAPFPPGLSAGERRAAREAVMNRWGEGWSTLDHALLGLTAETLTSHVRIRGQAHSVHAAVTRQVDHYAFHIGQINVIARLLVGTDRWTWFTLPPGGTAAFNEKLAGKR